MYVLIFYLNKTVKIEKNLAQPQMHSVPATSSHVERGPEELAHARVLPAAWAPPGTRHPPGRGLRFVPGDTHGPLSEHADVLGLGI